MAMLLITHDLGIVRKMADRVCVMTHGEIVEQAAPPRRSSRRRSTPIRKRLLAAEPKGRPAVIDPPPPIVLAASEIKVWFPIKAGLLRRTIGHVKAVDGVSLEVREGQTIGIVGEFGLGQDDARPRPLAPHPLHRRDRLSAPTRPRHAVRRAACGRCGASLQIVFQDPFSQPVAAPLGRRDRRGGAEGARHRRHGAGRGAA